MYRTAIQEYKASYFRERSSLSLFTRYMIAIINNCDRFEELSQNMKARWWKSGHHEAEGAGKFELLLKTFQEIRQESLHVRVAVTCRRADIYEYNYLPFY